MANTQDSARGPIFIFGSPRSGTSLLSRILNAHPAIGIPFESLFYSVFWPLREAYGDLTVDRNMRLLLAHMLAWQPITQWTPRVTCDEAWPLLKRRDIHGAIEAIICAWATRQGKARWGEKSPWHAYYWREILEGFPDAVFLHIVRDPRDATLSWKNARQGPRNVYVLARRWNLYLNHMQHVREELGADRLHELRYEELLAEPENTVRAVCNFLKEEFSPGMLDFHKTPGEYDTDATNRQNLARPLIRNNSGKWQGALSEVEVRWIESAARAQMLKWGYRRGTDASEMSSLECFCVERLVSPWSRLYGMARDVRGQREALQKLWFQLNARLHRTGDRDRVTPLQ